MNEYLASAITAERMNQYEDAHCPRNYCRHEFRDERISRKPIPLENV